MNICEKHLWPACKIILSVGAPIQKLFDNGGATHTFLNQQGLTLLKNDNKIKTYEILYKYRDFLDMGNLWADQGWKCFAHYYKPHNGKGFIPWVSAISESMAYYNRAILSWKNNKFDKSAFYLGAVAHIVQDMCVPHHAMGIAFNGHWKFESWADDNKEFFKLNKGGIYNKFRTLKELIDNNARIAQLHYNALSIYGNNYVFAGKKMLHLAQWSTAHLFDLFVLSISNNR